MTDEMVLEARDVHLRLRDRTKKGRVRRGEVEILAGVSLELSRGETLGLLGESGCGKSTFARVLCGLSPVHSGAVRFHSRVAGKGEVSPPTLGIQMVFQDPYGSLNPRRRVRDILAEGWQINRSLLAKSDWEARLRQLVTDVGLRIEHLERFPAALSGGERQRVAIARALSVNPEVVVCDEAVSALDASVKSQVISLLEEVQSRTGVAYLFISHDTTAVRQLADRVAVMYLGKIVETGPAETVFASPGHPYTHTLLAAVPKLRPWRGGSRRPGMVKGEIPSFASPPSGCRFRTRCFMAQDVCAALEPPETALSDGHIAACHFAGSAGLEQVAVSIGTTRRAR